MLYAKEREIYKVRNIFDEIVETLKYRQREEEIFVNVNRDDDFYRTIHDTRIGAFGDSIDIINQIVEELWTSALQEPSDDGEYIVHCRRSRDGKETISSAKYCFGDWKISNAFDLIGWMPYRRLLDLEQEAKI